MLLLNPNSHTFPLTSFSFLPVFHWCCWTFFASTGTSDCPQVLQANVWILFSHNFLPCFSSSISRHCLLSYTGVQGLPTGINGSTSASDSCIVFSLSYFSYFSFLPFPSFIGTVSFPLLPHLLYFVYGNLASKFLPCQLNNYQ